MSAEPTLAARKAAVLANLRAGRDLLAEVLEDAKLDEIYRASQWGVVDAVNHMSGGLSYHDMITRTLAEERPRFPAWATPEEDWAKKKARLISSVDDAIAFVGGLSEEQLTRVAICGTEEVPVIQFLEWGSDHYLEHGNQIKNEILPLARR